MALNVLKFRIGAVRDITATERPKLIFISCNCILVLNYALMLSVVQRFWSVPYVSILIYSFVGEATSRDISASVPTIGFCQRISILLEHRQIIFGHMINIDEFVTFNTGLVRDLTL